MAYWITKVLLTPVFYLLWRVKVEGREHLPTHGPAVLAANHQSFCDSFFLPLVLRRRVTYVAKAEYFDNWRTAWFFRAAGQIPMQRSGGDASQRALNTAMGVLDGGGLLAIYPEGTRAPDRVCTRGTPGWPGCPWPVMCRSSPWASSAPGRCSLREQDRMRPFHRVTVRSARRWPTSATDGGSLPGSVPGTGAGPAARATPGDGKCPMSRPIPDATRPPIKLMGGATPGIRPSSGG